MSRNTLAARTYKGGFGLAITSAAIPQRSDVVRVRDFL
jgi:hypothetical protein